MDAAESFWIRVLLLDNITDCTLKTASPFSVISRQTQATERRFSAPEVPVNVNIHAGQIAVGGYSIAGTEVVVWPEKPHVFKLNGSEYRGKLKLTINADGKSFDAINLVPLEPYLAGVVGAEMPSYWEAAALQAQAVAARTYCLYIKRRLAGRRAWDVRATQAHQVYKGLEAESAQVWGAVNRTWGQVLVSRVTNGSEEIFPAYYSAICGGHTENSKHVFGGNSFESLAGVACPYCKDVARPGLFLWPPVQFDKSHVTTSLLARYPKLAQLGGIKEIIAVRQSNYHEFLRVTLVELLGSAGKKDSLRAEDLRLTIDPTGRKLKSTACRITDMGDRWVFSSGRGYGHAVGMCQCGAQKMAREGKSARQILSYYYPGSKIRQVY